jgi:hypothetical protein
MSTRSDNQRIADRKLGLESRHYVSHPPVSSSKVAFLWICLFDLCGVTHPPVIRFRMGFCKKVRSTVNHIWGKFLERRRGADQSQLTILGRFPV